MLTLLRDAVWFDRTRLIGYAWALLWVEIAAFIFLVLGTHGLIVPLKQPTTTDFVSFYAAGLQAGAGHAAQVYDRAHHYAAEWQALGFTGTEYNSFFYPPVYLLLCQFLPLAPYLVSFVLFQGAGGLFYLWAIRNILPPGRTLVPFIAYPAVLAAVGIGQNSLLSAALFGGATLLLDRRPWLAGALFGCLAYKPHFGLLVPVALIAAGQWRALLAAALTASGLVALSLWLYGWATWAAFLALSAGATGQTFSSGHVPFAGLISPYAALRMIGVGDPASLIAQGMVTLTMAVLVALMWRRREVSRGARAMVLIGATLLSLPVILFYDLTLAAVALAWGWRDAASGGLASRFLPWEKFGYALVFLVPLLSRGLGHAYSIPIGPAAGIVLLSVGWVRARGDGGAVAR